MTQGPPYQPPYQPPYPAATMQSQPTTPSPLPDGSPIRERVAEAGQMLEMIHQVISALTDRLEPVLTPQPPDPAPQAATDGPQSDLYRRTLQLYIGLAYAKDRLVDLLRRIEV